MRAIHWLLVWLGLSAASPAWADKCQTRCSERMADCSMRCSDISCAERCSRQFDRCIAQCGPAEHERAPKGGKCFGEKGKVIPCPKP